MNLEYTCARCKLPMPTDRVPPPGAVCFPCGAEDRGRVSGVSRGYRALQQALAPDVVWPPETDDAEGGTDAEE